MAFLLTTAGIIFLNNKYNNVFKMDFTPLAVADSLRARTADSLRIVDSLKLADSLHIADSLKKAHTPDSLLKQETIAPETKPETKPEAKNTAHNEKAAQPPKKAEVKSKPEKQIAKEETKTAPPSKAKSGTDYNEWVKNTAELYELMDAKKAAKIIQKYSDNEARDILYAMKKKKAAEIISELSPEVVTRYMRKN
jgi:flagellar motility protein MotE (MotC chaperone)